MNSEPNPVRRKLEEARKDLLDLSLRNTLLNFRDLKARGVHIVDELSTEIFQILVLEEKTMSFLPKLEEVAGEQEGVLEWNESVAFEQPADAPESFAERHVDTKLQTPYSNAKLQRRLLNTHYLGNSSIQERGINVLYLALGMLHWYEDASSDLLRRAPLVLVPVTLYRTNVQSRFKLKYSGTEPGGNHCLELKLKQDFAIDLPAFPELEEIDFDSYFEAVALELAAKPRWSVEQNDISLGFFFFQKLLMYEDLDSERWPDGEAPHRHSLLVSLLGDGFNDDPSLFGEDRSLDDVVDPKTLLQVVDADSSQTVAIQSVLQGKNLVIQGPPGTGKSQTITNLIGEAIANGEKVLFVAEKMAALDVVKRRLRSIGVDDACLELHSHTANKRSFVQELARTLKLGRPGASGREEVAARIRQARDQLNLYAKEVNRPIGASGLSPFQVYGRFIKEQRTLESLSPPPFHSSGLATWTAAEFRERRREVRELEELIGRIGVPEQHPFWGSEADVYVRPMDGPQLKEAAQSAVVALRDLQSASTRLAEHLELPPPVDLEQVGRILRAAEHLDEAPPLEEVDVTSSAWTEQRGQVEEALELGSEIGAARSSHDDLLPDAWGSDVLSTRGTIAEYGDKWWRFLSPSYRQAKRELASLWKNEIPKSREAQLDALDAILLVKRLRADLEQLQELLGELYGNRPSETDDWRSMTEVFRFLTTVHDGIANRSLPEKTIELLNRREVSTELQSLRREVSDAQAEFRTALEEALLAAKYPQERTGSPWDALASHSLSALEARLGSWIREPERLRDIALLNQLSKKLDEAGLKELLKVATTWSKASSGLTSLFARARYAALVEQAFEERPVLASFTHTTHEGNITQFRKADELLLERNRVFVARQHHSELPQLTGAGQSGTLLHEMQKKRRHRPIRQLMSDAGNVIQAIKPVFMMSPLSIATFLPPGSVAFDLVVFDEASQIRPVDAFGALLRGQRAVVVGDTKQLPPTSFFDKIAAPDDDEGEEWEERTSDLESILGLFVAKGAPESMLRWHYRSRHESLITVSNDEFYEGKLTVFPSPDASKKELGLVFHHHPETFYERGRGRRYNREEAKIVAKAVMDHAFSRPDRTLGVASFSQAQMQAILDQLEILRRQDPSCEEFFSAHPEEPFFVKNLENVQGDERDVIFISVGYGRTKDGFISMNFGPLNKDGGERRLNVLITRARYRCEIFSNLTAEDIDLHRTQAQGVRAFKQFLKYADHGIKDLASASGEEADSVFEEEVAMEIKKQGYQVEHQVGSGGFFIDLAIVDPNQPGRYILGIECDGATYHSARWARDRDRLRQQVLEGLGWTIHRIWSTDWFNDPKRELKRVLESTERLRKSAPPEDNPTEGLGRFAVPRESQDQAETLEAADRHYAAYMLSRISIDLRGGGLHELPTDRIADWVIEVVEVESPIHLSEVASRITTAAGLKRTGSRIQEAVARGAKAAARRDAISFTSDQFLWKQAHTQLEPRDRSDLPNSSRKIELIAPAEIEAAILKEVSVSHGMPAEEIAPTVCRMLGFGRASQRMSSHVTRIVEGLLSSGILASKGEYVVASDDEQGESTSG